MKKILLFFLLTAIALLPLFGEGKSFSKPSVLFVMTKSYNADITYSLLQQEENEENLSVTVHAFSYGDKSMGDFTFFAEKQKDGTFSAKRQVVESSSGEKVIDVTILSAKIDIQRESVEIKYKPGKMPFAIKIQTQR